MNDQLARLGRSTLIYGVGQVLTRFISFLLLPLFTSYLTPADYGIMSILGLLAYVVTPIFSLGIGTAIGMCYFDAGADGQSDRKPTTIWSAFVLLAASTAILGLLAVMFGRQISLLIFHTAEYRYLVVISLLGTCLGILVTPFMLSLQLEERAKTYVAATALSTLASIALSVVLVIALSRGLRGMVQANVLGQGLTLACFMVLAIPKLSFRVSWALCKELLRLGLPFVPSFAFLFVMLQGNRYILQRFSGLDAVGIYSVGFNFGMIMNLAVNGFTNAWTPYFMSFVERREEARVLFGRIMTYYVLGFGALSLLFYIFAKPLVMIMTQVAFHDAYTVIGPSASAQFLIGVFSLLLPGMYFAKEVKFVTLIQALSAIAAVGLNLLLISWRGVLGAALALCFSALTMVLVQQAWNYRRKQVYLPVQYEWGRLAYFALFYLIYMVLALWDRQLPWLSELALSMVAATTLSVVLYALLHPDERLALWSAAKSLGPGQAGLWALAGGRKK